MRISLDAEARGFGGSMICNGYGTGGPAELASHYALTDGRLVLNGDITNTALFCGDLRLMYIEAAYLGVFEANPRVWRTPERLCLITDDGRTLEFSSTTGTP